MLSQRREKQLEISRIVILDALTFMVLRSPVGDTGLYRSNHEITFGSPATNATLVVRSEGELIDAGRQKLKELTLEKHGKVFIANPLIYAWPLEVGHSKQAPQGVYRIAQAHAKRLWTRLTV